MSTRSRFNPKPPAEPVVIPKANIEEFRLLSDVQVTVRAELDRRKITFGELVRLEPGSVVVLTRPAGENIDLYVEDVLLGSGEILVIDSTLAIRIADLRDKPPTPPKTSDLFDDDLAA
jgi:flagellar motor switch protein FliN